MIVRTGSSCLKVAWYNDDHMSGQSIYSNVVIGYQTGVFFHFGATNNATANLFIHCNTSVRAEACYNLPRDKWCNLPMNDTDKGDTMIAALHAAMKWPTWNTLWLETYPALRNISWAPSTTINNTADGNVAIGALAHGAVADHANATAAQFKVPRDTYAMFPPPKGNWYSATLAAAGFVAADPVAARDYRLAQSSPVWRETGGRWRQIPRGQGPRPG